MFQVSVIIHVSNSISNYVTKYVSITDRFHDINHNMGRWIGGVSPKVSHWQNV